MAYRRVNGHESIGAPPRRTIASKLTMKEIVLVTARPANEHTALGSLRRGRRRPE
jgi:hypothetical protein